MDDHADRVDEQRAERDTAMIKADAAADPDWKTQAKAALWWCARSEVTFTTDDVWDRLDSLGIPAPREARALGPIVTAALRGKAITDTGTWVPSRRRHAARMPVYKVTL